MKVLLSCFACAPYKGSEPGVGWNWAMALSKQNDVWVITREENRQEIENYEREHRLPFHVEYFGIERIEKIKRLPFKNSLYSLLWQAKLIKAVKILQEREKFDICHHCTYATFKFPSRLYKLGIPFVLGPVGGGEITPKSCRHNFHFIASVKEVIRNIQISLMKRLPSTKSMFAHADRILVTTEDTKMCVPLKFRSKTEVMQTIAIATNEIAKGKPPLYKEEMPFQLLYVGMLKEWKGFKVLADTLSKLNETYPGRYKLTVIGDGEDEVSIKKWFEQRKIDGCVSFLGRIEREQVLKEMRNAHAFVFPSYHDSGAMVVLEAMSAGIPVVAIATGGVKENLNNNVALLTSPDLPYAQIVESFYCNIIMLKEKYMNDYEEVVGITERARIHLLENCTWDIKAEHMQRIYRKCVQKD